MAPSASLHDLRYPIGRFAPEEPSPADAAAAFHHSTQHIAELPDRLAAALFSLRQDQLDSRYRDGGWTLRQLVHHVADSHINAYTRLRLALTEDWPVIKPYHEALWAELADARTAPVESSLALLVPLHRRWCDLLGSLEQDAWLARGYTHPESGPTNLLRMTMLYSWHGRHHTAHVLGLCHRMGW